MKKTTLILLSLYATYAVSIMGDKTVCICTLIEV